MISRKRAKQARRYLNKVMERHLLTTTTNKIAHDFYTRKIQDAIDIVELYIETCPTDTILEESGGERGRS